MISYAVKLCRPSKLVRDEVSTYPSIIYNSEVVKMQTSKGISIEEVALYIKLYSHFKSTFEKIREKIRPPLSDFESFDGEIKLTYTLTVDKEPFLRYDNQWRSVLFFQGRQRTKIFEGGVLNKKIRQNQVSSI